MNKIGIYYAYWTHYWDADFEPFVDKVADLGFDQLEVNAGTVANLSSDQRSGLYARAKERGIALSYCIGLSPEFDVSSPDSGTRRRGIEFLKKQVCAIGGMGGGSLSGIIYACWPVSADIAYHEKSAYWSRSVSSLKEAAQVAEDQNVILNVEVVNRFEQFLLNTCQEALEYVDAVDSPNVKILLDTFHMNIEEESIYKAITQAGQHLGHVHIGENNRTPPGSGRGHIDWAELGSALKEIGFRGALVMEPFLLPGGDVGRDIRVFRDLSKSLGLPDLDEEARKACVFMREVLAQAGIQ